MFEVERVYIEIKIDIGMNLFQILVEPLLTAITFYSPNTFLIQII